MIHRAHLKPDIVICNPSTPMWKWEVETENCRMVVLSIWVKTPLYAKGPFTGVT